MPAPRLSRSVTARRSTLPSARRRGRRGRGCVAGCVPGGGRRARVLAARTGAWVFPLRWLVGHAPALPARAGSGRSSGSGAGVPGRVWENSEVAEGTGSWYWTRAFVSCRLQDDNGAPQRRRRGEYPAGAVQRAAGGGKAARHRGGRRPRSCVPSRITRGRRRRWPPLSGDTRSVPSGRGRDPRGRGEAGWYRETAPLAPAGVSGFRLRGAISSMERVVEHQDRISGQRRGDWARRPVLSGPACSADSLLLLPSGDSSSDRGRGAPPLALVRPARCLATHGAQPDKRGTKRSA